MAVAETSVRRSPESPEVTEVEVREEHWRRIRRRAAVGYGVVLTVFVLLVGIPTDREGLVLWIVAGLGIRCLGRGWRSFGGVLLDWLPFTAVLIVYDYTRGFADGLGMPIHVHGPINADLWIFHGVLPTQWMQQHFYTPGVVHWYDAAVTLVYTSHFVATPVVAAVLWLRNRREWSRFISRVIALAFVGVTVYILYPATPPWLASRDGVIDPVARLTSRGWTELGLNHAGQVLSKGQAAVNLVAAMPSLHTAYATLITLFFLRRVRWWWRVPLAVYPLAMGAALVYSGEHYAVDVFFGWATGIAVIVAAAVVEPPLVARRRARALARGQRTGSSLDGVRWAPVTHRPDGQPAGAAAADPRSPEVTTGLPGADVGPADIGAARIDPARIGPAPVGPAETASTGPTDLQGATRPGPEAPVQRSEMGPDPDTTVEPPPAR
jgi:PAP2 superfamily.